MLSWNFTNLAPFETREITVTFNVNSPMETPAVNIGNVLTYTATITGLTDETPADNVFTLNQIVIGSYDPNDKKCMQGATITTTQVGEFVDYVIRFENTGTYMAEKVVIKDIIDTSKFDIASITPIKASHSYIIDVRSGNQVYFTFDNINLPFDDANNDGYVAFKIKTKSTLVAGDTFTNGANIYFDYNPAIVTNVASTAVVTTLGVSDFDFSNNFVLYPNPAQEVLHITSKNNLTVQSVAIYNMLGQQVLLTQNIEAIDVSRLSSGNYVLKIISDQGVSSTKFIKE
ncbi:T9SS type A sorting domain-containing protein [Flavobacterium lacisediminis]|uniref:T9SS type A sorting domain-containing protein n=1 Tax=Flavobacterium lacisediminis TaxID=2989705 RepID=A0ABT3EJT5_9FLAO|nr:T9SS type A sorting domain-containing protein [Flavobacterium lacisediminis]MCW1148832.1 T9SS type A sorting domain-containing protein [Flavobacterium lacisediminis]